MDLTLAIDVAGTQIRAGLIDPHEQHPTRFPLFKGPLTAWTWDYRSLQFDPDVIDKIVDIAIEASGSHKAAVQAIGVASTGAIDIYGRIRPNHDPTANPSEFLVPLSERIASTFGSQVLLTIGNRSDMAAWGEFKYGFGSSGSVPHLVFLTLGSGIGGGIVANRNLFLGEKGFAGQFGHMLADANSDIHCDVCGRTGCLSSVIAGKAILQQLAAKHNEPAVAHLLKKLATNPVPATEDAGYIQAIGPHSISARSVVKAASAGDKTAHEAVMTIAKPLALAVAQITGLLDPTLIVLGGIVHDAVFIENALPAETTHYLPPFRQHINTLERTVLGDRAPLYGAAAWVWDKPQE